MFRLDHVLFIQILSFLGKDEPMIKQDLNFFLNQDKRYPLECKCWFKQG